NGHGSFFGQCPLRMCKSVPQTPQAPILISAAFLGTWGQGTVRITGLAPGPSKVETRICSIARSRLERGQLDPDSVILRWPRSCARPSKDERPRPSPTDLGFTRGRITSAQVGYSRLAMARAKGRGRLRVTERRYQR